MEKILLKCYHNQDKYFNFYFMNLLILMCLITIFMFHPILLWSGIILFLISLPFLIYKYNIFGIIRIRWKHSSNIDKHLFNLTSILLLICCIAIIFLSLANYVL